MRVADGAGMRQAEDSDRQEEPLKEGDGRRRTSAACASEKNGNLLAEETKHH